MRNFFTLFLLFFLLMGSFLAQPIKQCKAGEECSIIDDCPQFATLLRSRNSNSIQRLRSSICNFRNRRPMVCCSVMNTRIATTPAPDIDVLPKFCGRPLIQDRIIGGAATEVGAYPWLVALGYRVPGKSDVSYQCGGSIISSKYVMTAGHCVHRSHLGRRRLAHVYLGAWDLASDMDCIMIRNRRRCYGHIAAAFEQIIVHPEFDVQADSANDIALIRLKDSINFESPNILVEPVCLPANNLNVRNFAGNRKPVAAGWGLTEHNNNSNVVLSVRVPIVEEDHCRRIYLSRFIGKQLCVGGEKGRDTCMGDSGGPLVLSEKTGPPYTQIGIVSFGFDPCGAENRPGVYAAVHDYMPWIMQTIKP